MLSRFKIFIFILIFVICHLAFVTPIYAQDTPVPPPTVPCNEVRPDAYPYIPFVNTNTEFSSLRPYQASPCKTTLSNTANFCGDSLSLIDTINVTYNPGADSCTPIDGGRVQCSYNVTVPTRTVSIDLKGAKLPILGNTQDTENYKNETSSLSNADKVNDYVSWYLNGTIFRSEDPYLFVNIPIPIIGAPISNLINSLYAGKLINYSGPLRKLLPFYSQLKIRSGVVQQAIDSKSGTTTQRHDQVVACDIKIITGIFSSLETGIPIPCNSVVAKILNLDPLSLVKPNLDRLTKWDGHLPPLEDDKNADGTPKYKTRLDYWAAYETWRGNTCKKLTIPTSLIGVAGNIILGEDVMKTITSVFGSSIPNISFLLCFDNPLNPNYYADLFPYIPFSSTEDVTGSATVNNVTISSNSSVTITNPVTNFTSATLFFPHMEETTQLASILQSTFAYQGADTKGSPTGVAPGSGSCQITNVRSGAGDDLFATGISGTFSYTAGFTCDFNQIVTTPDPNCISECVQNSSNPSTCNAQCTPINSPQTCTKSVPISLAISTETPLIEDIWSQLVAGPASVFKRIFPMLGPGSPLGSIQDIPASTSVTYSGAANGTGTLYFPHVGSIQEYFLNGIQTALRPKGYGNPIALSNPASSSSCSTPVPAGTCDGIVFQKFNPPAQTTANAASSFNSYVLPNLTSQLLAVYKEAERQTGVPCEVIAGVHYREVGNDPNLSLQNGSPLNGMCLLDSAIQAGNEIKAKVGGSLNTWSDLITALSRYNGGGNHNCRRDTGTPGYQGPCPPPEGIDDPYPTNWLDAGHDPMYTIYCYDFTQCAMPYPYTSQLGALTIATELYHSEK